VSNLFGERDIDGQARAWVVELDDEPVSPERVAELRAWLGRSPSHRRAFEQAVGAWRDMDGLSTVLNEAPVASVAAGLRAASPPPSRIAPAAPKIGSLRAVIFAAAAALLLGGVLTSVALIWHPNGVPATSSTYETATGEVTTIALSDGSKIHLNTGSRVSVSYGSKARTLQLVRGEAYFEVAPSPQRPFVVYAGRFAVRALGTAFAVHMLNSGVDLTVTQGHVELAAFAPQSFAGTGSSGAGETAEASYSLSGGQHATVAGDVRLIEQIDAKGIEKRLAWREGMLIFDDDPLADVVAEIGRYTSRRIVITDPSIRTLKIGGYFKVRDISSILDTFQENFGIEVKQDNDNVVYLARGRPAH
jgi:transmembrane sensor